MRYVGSGGGSKVLWEGCAVRRASFTCKVKDLFGESNVVNLMVSGYFPWGLYNPENGGKYSLAPPSSTSHFRLASGGVEDPVGGMGATPLDEQFCEIFTFEKGLYNGYYYEVLGNNNGIYPHKYYFCIPYNVISADSDGVNLGSSYTARVKEFNRYRVIDGTTSATRLNMGVLLWFEGGLQEDAEVVVEAGLIGPATTEDPSDWNSADTSVLARFITTQVKKV